MYLKCINFRIYLFSWAKKSFFASTYFREWQVFENFKFKKFCKTTESEKKMWVAVKNTYLRHLLLNSIFKFYRLSNTDCFRKPCCLHKWAKSVKGSRGSKPVELKWRASKNAWFFFQPLKMISLPLGLDLQL